LQIAASEQPSEQGTALEILIALAAEGSSISGIHLI
jgi:hypothetical protein